MTNVRSSALPDLGWSPSLFSLGPARPDPDFTTLARRELSHGAWVDHAPDWLAGSGPVYECLVDRLAWSVRRTTMYGVRRDEPRLTAGWPGPGLDPVVGPLVEEVRHLLSGRYGVDLATTWANLYRHGHDSVAWHGDRVLRQQDEALVAIVSLGERRPFRLRPGQGGTSVSYDLGQGDLLVMGGTCQRTWQHSVPKVRRAGPRLSLSFRAVRPTDVPRRAPPELPVTPATPPASLE